MVSMLKQLVQRFCISNPNADVSKQLYWKIVEQARQSFFYTQLQVPDTIDGRFDCLLMHLYLVVDHLNQSKHDEISDYILDLFVKDMDRSLRQTGVGDHSISRKMRKIGEAYAGRMKAYSEADFQPDQLAIIIHKNLYRLGDVSQENLDKVVMYMIHYDQKLNGFEPSKPLPIIAIE